MTHRLSSVTANAFCYALQYNSEKKIFFATTCSRIIIQSALRYIVRAYYKCYLRAVVFYFSYYFTCIKIHFMVALTNTAIDNTVCFAKPVE